MSYRQGWKETVRFKMNKSSRDRLEKALPNGIDFSSFVEQLIINSLDQLDSPRAAIATNGKEKSNEKSTK